MSPAFTRRFQGTLLWIPTIVLLAFAYGACTLYGRRVQSDFGCSRSDVRRSKLHISRPSQAGFGLPYSVLVRHY